jgi:hypothetical protein
MKTGGDKMEQLPIRFFSKRENDVMQTEGGGGNLPKFVLFPNTDENILILKAKSKKINDVLTTVSDSLKTKIKEKSLLPSIVKTTLNEEAIAKSHRKVLRELFISTEKTDDLLGFDGENELLIEINNLKQADNIMKRSMDIDNSYYPLSCINTIEVFKPRVETIEGINNYKLKIIPYKDKALTKYIVSRLDNYLSINNFDYSKTMYTDNMEVYKLKNITLDNISGLLNIDIADAFFAIEPIDRYKATLDSLSEEKPLKKIVPEDEKEYPIIGVLDSGISNTNPYLAPWIKGQRSPYLESELNKSHGTFVAGILVYGDLLEDNIDTLSEPCYLFDAAVFPAEGIDEDDLIRNIQEIVRAKKSEIKIWNMSLGGTQEVKKYKFSDFAIALDALQDECDVLICTSCGNTQSYCLGEPKEKITNSADSVRSLVVGSAAQSNGLVDMNYPSPFSRIGRGPCSIIKPDLVHMGGNIDIHLNQKGVVSLGLNGIKVKACGTSFSTPRITSMLGTLKNNLNIEFDPLLLKALLIHSAHYPENIKLIEKQKIEEMGYGIPKNINQILHNSQDEVTLILNDTLEKGKYLDIFDFPMPECLIKNDFFTGEIIVTLVCNSIIDPTQGSEYCQSQIDIYLGTYDNLKDRDIKDKKNLKNPIGRNNSKNILNKDLYSKKAMQANTKFTCTERLLINNNSKFYPVKKYAIDLSDMAPKNKLRYLDKNKKWYLKVDGLYRENSELNSDSLVLNQDFCLIITIRDPSKNSKVYDGAVHKLNEYNFIHNSIEIRNRANIKINE